MPHFLDDFDTFLVELGISFFGRARIEYFLLSEFSLAIDFTPFCFLVFAAWTIFLVLHPYLEFLFHFSLSLEETVNQSILGND